jgi:4-aminobutyrate aminotransferase
LGGGLPLSAVVGPKEIMDHAPAFALQTTAGNPVATAAGRVVLRALQEEDLAANAERVGNAFMQGLRALGKDRSIIGNVRGRGLAVGVELIDGNTGEPVPVVTTAKIIYRAYQLGAAFVYVGLRGNVLEFTPPLTLTESEVGEALGIIDQSLRDVVADHVSDAEVAPFMMW